MPKLARGGLVSISAYMTKEFPFNAHLNNKTETPSRNQVRIGIHSISSVSKEYAVVNAMILWNFLRL
jgi:hypothetical protein